MRGPQQRRRLRRRSSVVVVAAVALTGCASPSLPKSDRTAAFSDDSTTIPAEASTTTTAVAPEDPVDFVIDMTGESQKINPRLFGTNVPAWLGPDLLADEGFVLQTIDLGTTLLRMPGGSWSNVYQWSACEQGDHAGCLSSSAARPSDFIGFMEATGLPGMWTLSINESAQSAAAAVAFFNGSVGDTTEIGVDRYGRDWSTVDRWARLRADHGHPDAVGIELWEVGNEVYGGRPEAGGPGCPSFGWEEVWTCDGAEYVIGNAEHDGYLAIRAAMLAVDPSIQVGAVGVGDPGSWSNWGNEVIETAGDSLDFYIVHQYGFESSPSGEDALDRPRQLWPGLIDGLYDRLGDIPVVVSEYNLVANESRDPEHTMTEAMNALYLADSIGQFATYNVAVANVWNLANGTTSSGTDYGLISVEDGHRFPAYDAVQLWSRAGSELLDVGKRRQVRDVNMYATRHEDGRLTLIVVNASDAVTATVGLDGYGGDGVASMSGVLASNLSAPALEQQATIELDVVGGTFDVEIPRWSISVIEIGDWR